MIKSKELTDPNSCMSKAGSDEMTFVLLARDACAPETIRHWCGLRIQSGKNKSTDPQITEAMVCANTMEHQKRTGIARLSPELIEERCEGCDCFLYDIGDKPLNYRLDADSNYLCIDCMISLVKDHG